MIWNAENCTEAGSDDSIFYGCSKLANVTIGKTVKTIPAYAFRGCSSLTSITIPDGVTSIGDGAFYGCSSLMSIVVDNDNQCFTSIDGNLYDKDKTKLIRYAIGKTDASFIIPDSVTSICDYAFEDCSSLTDITISDSVTSIGGGAFYGCSSLTSITITAGVTSIGERAFAYCNSLTSVTIGNGVTSINSFAFSGCSGLTSVIIPDGVTSIGSYAFTYCSSLKSITIPDSITSIGSYAFRDCSWLKTVFYKGTAEQWKEISIGSYNTNLTNAARYYYSETEPALNSDGTAYNGNYWHYDTDGKTPVIWKKEN